MENSYFDSKQKWTVSFTWNFIATWQTACRTQTESVKFIYYVTVWYETFRFWSHVALLGSMTTSATVAERATKGTH